MGASGSAKIEGHIKFLEIFDLKPFLTEELSGKVKNMFCRLFAVIVHSGKNSHSGHYVAYVRNISKNEWWKMDDARVSRATSQEVLNAEAYMLFYRVVDHPVAQDLRAKQAEVASFSTSSAVEAPVSLVSAAPVPTPMVPNISNLDAHAADDNWRKRKRETTEFSSGEEWAKSKTSLPPSVASFFRRAEEFVSENIEFTQEFFKLVMSEVAKGKNGHGPLARSSKLCESAPLFVSKCACSLSDKLSL